MKDITDYFSSPTKVKNSSAIAENVKGSQELADQNVNTENKIDKLNKSKSNKDGTKQIKKKRRRKPTDPEVKDVTELLSLNLSLISPNTSGTKVNSPSPLKKKPRGSLIKRTSLENSFQQPEKRKSCENKKNNNVNNAEKNKLSPKNDCSKNTPNKFIKSKSPKNFKENNESLQHSDAVIDIESSESNSENSKETPKVNAFQFLMNSRNSIIGQNSNGQAATEPDKSGNGDKSTLAARKDLFKNWADQKGALKRKREEEEIEKCINHKLEKRAKRLKNLLQGKPEEKNKKKVKSAGKSKKKVKALTSSESETSSEPSEQQPVSNLSLANVTEIIEENAQDIVLKISSPSPKKMNGQNNLLNFFGVISKEDKEERIEVFDDSSNQNSKELIKIKMFTPKSNKKKNIHDESSQESVKIKKHKKKKKKSKDIDESSQCEIKLNDSLEDFCSPDAKKKSKAKKEGAKDKKQSKRKQEGDEGEKNYVYSNSVNYCDFELGETNLLLKECGKEEIDAIKKDWSDDEEEEEEIKKGDSPEMVEASENVSDIKGEKMQESNTKNLKNFEKIVDKKSNIKTRRTKSCIIDDDKDLEEQKSCYQEDVEVMDESTQESDVVIRPKTRRKTNHIIDEDDDSRDETKDQVMTPRTRKKKKTVNKVIQDSTKGSDTPNDKEIASEHVESQGRVLRPKRNNLNYSDLFKDETPKAAKENHEEKLSVKKSKKKSNKNESVEKVTVSSDSEYEDDSKKKSKVSVKVAPVFLKATPKPKVDPEVIEARKKFLMSGVPDSLKITVEKQRIIEEKEYDIFPTISHIQQKCESQYWDLPKPDLKYTEILPFKADQEILTFNDLTVKKVPYEVHITTDIEKVDHIKDLLDKIKAENPNYPVYKVFRHIYEKSGKNFLDDQAKGKKTPKRRSKKTPKKTVESSESTKIETVLKFNEMWSEKYKPRSSDEILGNHKGVSALKTWLETWMNYSQEINARGKRKRANSNSDSDFESTDCDSRDSTRLPGNTMILGGPCGSGKTSAIYAIASELGFNVLELNASSKRTGKRLIQELQEATQSHQVRKNNLANFFNSENNANKNLKDKKKDLKDKKLDANEKSDQKDEKKMCILLVEDVDLVFEQDEGFLTSLSQLIVTSKRPIILTTTDNSPAHIQKLLGQYEYISFMPLSLQCLEVWLQIVCLVEGLLVEQRDLGNLLEYNRGDIRKTLLEVQFWCQSGGQLEKTRVVPLKIQKKSRLTNSDLTVPDEELKIALSEGNSRETRFVHKNCLGSFEIFRENKLYNVPKYLDLGMVWWNIPNILGVPSCAEERLHKQNERQESKFDETSDNCEEINKQKLNSLLNLYNALVLTDSLFKTINYHVSNEPVVKNWVNDVRDSLELTERKEEPKGSLDMIHEVTHTLVDGCIEQYSSIDGTECGLNMAMPDTTERRWRAKQHICEDFLKEPIPLTNTLERTSVALDYLPMLRDIVRFEDQRAAVNTKRGNRFRHYLRNLNMDFKESSCKLACNILRVNDDE